MQALPLYIWFEIFNNLEDASDVARLMCVCKDWRTAGYNVKSVRFTISNNIHERARNDPSYEGKPFKKYVGWPTRTSEEPLSLKDVLVGIIEQKPNLLQLRIEVDATLQSKSVQEEERRRTDFWITDSHHLSRWLPYVEHTLQHLCIVDYGQQAIMRRSKIVQLLSKSCECSPWPFPIILFAVLENRAGRESTLQHGSMQYVHTIRRLLSDGITNHDCI